MKIAGVILAGGKASRYNSQPKGLLELPSGETIIERLLSEMEAVGVRPRVICADDERLYAHLGVPVIPDITKDIGPLGGIEAALRHFKDLVDAVLFLPCDTPNITAVELRELCDRFKSQASEILVAETDEGTWHPLCSVVHVGMYEEVARAVRERCLAVARLWRELGAASTRFEDAVRFANINVLGDFAQALEAAEEIDGPVHRKARYNSIEQGKGENSMPVSSIDVPETMRGDLVAFLSKEGIGLAVSAGGENEITVISSEERRECTISELYPGGWITCEVARAIAEKLNVRYRDVGKILNFYEIKIRECGLGCF
ncbi:MAG: NTP transferase domain-containing protein [Candidatus Latescibacteria bacterium]|nr:NTP transferase domain-containing protein [Candidatus Latescibacterota bacterium]NIM66319.1 NTP transferase domain-containing protein [Candidatus Latescibacterota bacterium]NIO02798.1 NTP transferase domain-containing protein [Candidatus Latescibacterota bacterium]NIO29933.1 NTP transferase domain-containing protein [Candidatus Latescibacterota bacterium]NIO57548.1 NTP transferase domain-containing protein [Candidatus Latescibacterota bacterium]